MNKQMNIYIYCNQRDRQLDRQYIDIDRQIDRQIDRYVDRQIDRQIDRPQQPHDESESEMRCLLKQMSGPATLQGIFLKILYTFPFFSVLKKMYYFVSWHMPCPAQREIQQITWCQIARILCFVTNHPENPRRLRDLQHHPR